MPIQPSPALPAQLAVIVRKFGMSPSRVWVLYYLARHPNSTVREVAQESDLTREACGRTIRTLVESGLVIPSDPSPKRRGKSLTYQLDAEAVAKEIAELRDALLPPREQD